MQNWFRGLAAAVALTAAAPVLADNNQIIINFDDLAAGTGDFSFDAFGNPLFRNTIFGGVITIATLADPAMSGMQVYRGTAIGFRLDDPFDFSWPAIGAFVTGSAPITLTLKAYDQALTTEVVVFTGSVAGGTTNFYFGNDGPGDFTSALFESTEAFSIDNLTFGLVDVPPGIPEPATWLLLLGGFALVGAAMRRPKVAVSYP